MVLKFDINIPLEEKDDYYKYAFYKGDYISINQALEAINWEEEFSGKTTQQCWDMFQTLTNELIKEHVPMKKT